MSEKSISLSKNSTSLSEKLSLSFDVAMGGNLLEAVQVIQNMSGSHARHPLDPLSPAEISVAVAAVRAAGATPEVRDGVRFIEVSLVEPEKHVLALADAYFFPPSQPSLITRTKGVSIIPSKLPPRQAKLTVYNRKSNETSIWVVELCGYLCRNNARFMGYVDTTSLHI